jgi:predicted lipid-binding transport protein (Tim44 family)
MLAIAAIGLLVLAPAIADARPGGNSSSGSRGSRTYSAPPATNTAPQPAQPMQRTQQPAPGPQQAAPGAAARPGAAAPASRGFGGAMMAGLLGAGIFGLLLGAGAFGNLGSFAAILGLLLQVALIGGLVAFVVMLVRRRAQPQAQPAGMPREMMQDTPRAVGGGVGTLGGSAGGRPVDEIGITPADQQAFGTALVEVNRAWSAQDVPALQRLATPEMMSFFRDDGLALEARGWRNETSDIRLEQADVAEAWNEGARDYATVALKFSLIDVTRRVADGAVMEGSPTERQTATELWTFVRVQGGPWMVSAIQQAG